MTEKRESEAYRLKMRNAGYADGLAGRAARLNDAEYQRSWRRGREQRGVYARGGA